MKKNAVVPATSVVIISDSSDNSQLEHTLRTTENHLASTSGTDKYIGKLKTFNWNILVKNSFHKYRQQSNHFPFTIFFPVFPKRSVP